MPDIRLELALGANPDSEPSTWTWTDVTPRVGAQEVSVAVGRPEGDTDPTPASATITLDNRDGALTPDHAGSPYYPHVRLGTPARLWVRAGERHLLVPNRVGARARVDDVPELRITGDLDVRVEVALDRVPAQWATPAPETYLPHDATSQELIGRYYLTETGRSWRLLVDEIGCLRLAWSRDGTASTFTEVASTDAIPYGSGERCALRATLDVADGSGGHAISFYTARSISGPWRRLGAPVALPGSTQIHPAVGTPLDLGDIAQLGFARGAGRWYRAQVRAGIDGELVADADFTARPLGYPTSWVDSVGRSWLAGNGAEIVDWQRRLAGEIAEIAPEWPHGDLSDPDAGYEGESTVTLTIAGVLRRLGAGQPPLQSTLRRRIPADQPAGYWPLEDGPQATQGASAVDGVRSMTWRGAVRPSQGTPPPGAASVVTLDQGASWAATPRRLTPGQWRIEFLYNFGSTMPSTTALQEVVVAHTTGTWSRLAVYLTSVSIQLRGWRAPDEGAPAEILTNTAAPGLLDGPGGWGRMILRAVQIGPSTTIYLHWVSVGGGGFMPSWTGTATAGAVTRITATPGPELAGMQIGHLSVLPDPASTAYVGADNGYSGERALNRIRRIARETGAAITAAGVPDLSPRMGPQRVATVLDLVQDCAAADGGVLSERRTVPGLEYRARHLLYSPTVRLPLDARAVEGGRISSEIAHPFTPVLEDTRLRNAVTVSRPEGSSETAEDAASIAAAGRRPGQAEVNLADDADLADQAHWRLALGSWPGLRYPAVTTDLVVAPQRTDDWLSAAAGTRAVVTGLPPQHPGDADLLLEHLTERITPHSHSVTATCSPAGSYLVGVVTPEEGEGRDAPHHVDTDGSILAAAVGREEETLLVTATAGPRWVVTGGPESDPADVPLDLLVGGELVTAHHIGAPLVTPLPITTAARAETTAVTAHVAPPVTTPSGGYRISAWCTYGYAGTYTPPVGMVTAGMSSGSFSSMLDAVELAPAAAPARTATFAPADRYSALTIVVGAWPQVLIDYLYGVSSIGPVTLTTAASTPIGATLILLTGWDEDPDGVMPDPAGGPPWTRIADTGAVPHTSRLTAWTRQAVGGAEAITVQQGPYDVHVRLYVIAPASTGPQPVTVTRGVGGVRLVHPAGAQVRLARPMITAL
ncbi:hypothetical protein [Streptomyces lonarensis]|uniref:Uncharacterized protein n=1 Tax=Streptomyces lonarensis TaxID=700599 RepID=A0A7X6CXA7_9ACTN|nr:hypothetical protein [Streptomyces lonarensis]NJQ04296.1 hypothetical protein [Streptomyces lonarensis]